METLQIQPIAGVQSDKSIWTGRIIRGLCILFLLFDAVMKIVKEIHTIEASARIGWPADTIQGLGIVLLICTILYMIPRTAFFGAILLSAYLGGATAIMVRSGQPIWFPVIFGVLVWCGLLLRDEKLRAIVWSKKDKAYTGSI